MLNVFHSVVLGIYAHSGESSYKFCLLGFETAFTTVVNKNAVNSTPVPIALELGQSLFDGRYYLFVVCKDVFLLHDSTAAQIVFYSLPAHFVILIHKTCSHAIDDINNFIRRDTSLIDTLKQNSLHEVYFFACHSFGNICVVQSFRVCYRCILFFIHPLFYGSTYPQTIDSWCRKWKT